MDNVFLLPLLALAVLFSNTIPTSRAAPVDGPVVQPGANFSQTIISLNTSFFQVDAFQFSSQMEALTPLSSVSSQCPSYEHLITTGQRRLADLLLMAETMKSDITTSDKDGCQWGWECRYSATRYPPFYLEAVMKPTSLERQACPLVDFALRSQSECRLIKTKQFVPKYESVGDGSRSWFLKPEELAVAAKCSPLP